MHRKSIRLITMTALIWGHAALAVDDAALADILKDAREEMDVPGLRAAVRYPDGRMVRAAAGLADLNEQIPLDNEVGMPGGSTGKTFVAALTMVLIEDGVLSLDDPVAKWLDEKEWFARIKNSEEILVRHLLSHSSGLGDYPDKVRFNMAMVARVIGDGSAYFAPEELIRYAGKSLKFPPGQGYAYSDVGYLVLGRVLEAVTGQSYYDLLRDRILEPQNLDQIWPQDQSALSNITPGYQSGVSNLKKDGRMKLDPRSEWTGGGLVTNPSMLVQFFGALAEGRIVEPDSLAKMLECGWSGPSVNGIRYGLGLFVDQDGEWFGHDGKWVGYRTHVTHVKSTGITIAVQTNQDDRTDLHGLVRRIAELASNRDLP